MTTQICCPCNPKNSFEECCNRYHSGLLPESAGHLMRARYSAYAKQNIDFIRDTTLPIQQADLDIAGISEWSLNSQWLGLEVIAEHTSTDQRHATVEFIAHWQDAEGHQQHQEKSLFINVDERWYFYDPTVPLQAERNAACPCGSTLKFKKCCGPYL